MARRIVERIREKIRLGQYGMTAHAMEEMAEDNLDILDVERTILSGSITRIDKDKLKEALYDTSYNLMILENNWVKGVFMYINGVELIKYSGINNAKLVQIQEEVLKKGIYRLVNRIGIFKKIEYHITGFWDY